MLLLLGSTTRKMIGGVFVRVLFVMSPKRMGPRFCLASANAGPSQT